MRKILMIPLIAIFLITCQKEQPLQTDNVATNDLVSNDFKTTEDVFLFLSHEMPELYAPDEITRLESMLEEPKLDDFKRSGITVELPAGSVDALQTAVDEAGPGGTVLVKAGEHTENGLVTIGHRVNLIGEDGAIILIENPVFMGQLTGGIWLNEANRSQIRNIGFSTSGDFSTLAILIQNSDRVVISENTFNKFQFTILINHSDHVNIRKNQIVAEGRWQSGGPNALGITNVNGRSASIVDNSVSNAVFGIWCCDRGGVSWGNNTEGNLYGQIICKVPDGFLGPDGVIIGSDDPGNHWLVALNKSSNNIYGGIVVIDGAHHNVLLANSGSGNGAYDVDLVGDSERFGFLTPTSMKNRVYSFASQTIKDCGEDNKVVGGTIVDTSEDPCDNVEQ